MTIFTSYFILDTELRMRQASDLPADYAQRIQKLITQLYDN